MALASLSFFAQTKSRLNANFNSVSAGIILAFAAIYANQSLISHYNFKSSAFDLGIFNKAMYDYSVFQWSKFTLLTPPLDNLLADHFSVFHMIFAPFRYIFGTYNLLIFQILFILFGGTGVHMYLRRIMNASIRYCNLAMIAFFSTWGVFSALAFDYHDNVIGAMLLPWFLLFFKQGKRRWMLVFFISILLCKEVMALWMFFVCSGLVMVHWKDSKTRNLAAILSIVSACYFLIVTSFLIPWLSGDQDIYLHFNYSALGADYGEAINTILTRPFHTIQTFFTNHTNDPYGDYVKVESIMMFLISGGLFLVFRPAYLWMAIPLFAMKFFNDDVLKWGISHQYSIEFVPLLAIGAFSFIHRFRRKMFYGQLMMLVVILATYSRMNERVTPHYDKYNFKFYDAQHFIRSFDVDRVHTLLSRVPDDLKVSAHFQLVPHLAFRDVIYEFPQVRDADVIIILKDYLSHPIKPKEYQKEINKYRYSRKWMIEYEGDKLIFFKRRGGVELRMNYAR